MTDLEGVMGSSSSHTGGEGVIHTLRQEARLCSREKKKSLQKSTKRPQRLGKATGAISGCEKRRGSRKRKKEKEIVGGPLL